MEAAARNSPPSPMGGLLDVRNVIAYKELHGIAILTKPAVDLDEDNYVIAILQPNKSIASPDADDWFWLRVRGKHTVAKLMNAYYKKFSCHVTLSIANGLVAESTQTRQLDYLRDRIIVFTANYSLEPQSLSSQISSSSAAAGPAPNRAPLQPVNAQLMANANTVSQPNIKSEIKTESAQSTNQILYQSPDVKPTILGNSHTGMSFGQPSIRNGTRQGTSITSAHNRTLSHESLDFAFRTYDRPEGHSSVFGAPVAPSSYQPADQDSSVNNDDPAASGDDSFENEESDGLPSKNARLQNLIQNGSPGELEREVRSGQLFLNDLKLPMVDKVSQHKDASHWVQQIETLQKHSINVPTIIGVVGNTGAGKSSVINAMLDEERLIPQNCMRACTAVVTEITWNSRDEPDQRYRAAIEFINAAEWAKDLRISLTDLMTGEGSISSDIRNADSEAGIAYAKIKAVYPNKTKEDLASSSVEQLMNVPAVKAVLGTIKDIKNQHSGPFYKQLQQYVDSKEKSNGGKKKKGDKEKEIKQMEFWPLIRVVRIYTKSRCLRTGAIVVDLPGVHDSNAARAAVAARYLKQCTGLWIVAPIGRAVDDKSAKNLLGESFKRQLKYDGTYSRVTFICSKTDDISLVEASDSLGLGDDMAVDWERSDAIDKEIASMKQSLMDLRESREVYNDIMSDADELLEIWEKLKDDLEDGKEVFAPSEKNKKRKRSKSPAKPRKKSKTSSSKEKDDDFIDDDDEDDEEDDISSSGKADDEAEEEEESEKSSPLTTEEIDEKISQFREDKKRARRQRIETLDEIKELNKKVKEAEKKKADINTTMCAVCVRGRNEYSKGAIQTDFAAGIKELDQENAQEEDEDNFNPDEDIRDYEEVARSLPVFCVSSRAYQKLSGRCQREADVPGFSTVEETEIPQLQAHCEKLTEAGRASNCRRFLTDLNQLLTSLNLWASNDGTGVNMSNEQLAAEARYLKTRLRSLEKSLEKAVQETLDEMKATLAENIYDNFEHVLQLAIEQAAETAHRWGDRNMGGYFWSTYKALCRRDGVFTNAHGPHDLNMQLAEPIMKGLAGNWERAFARRLPKVIEGFTKKTDIQLKLFHKEIEKRCMKAGAGVAGLAMLGHQLRNYKGIFTQLAQQMVEVINGLQREANREFTPMIATNLAESYEWCAAEVGQGQFNRMKGHMNAHIEQNREKMFQDAVDEVKGKLRTMCRVVEEQMADKADEVFMKMTRDYTQVVSGTQLPNGEAMPKWERKMRSDVAQVIEDHEKAKELEAKSPEDVDENADENPDSVKGISDDTGNDADAQIQADLLQQGKSTEATSSIIVKNEDGVSNGEPETTTSNNTPEPEKIDTV